MQALKLIVIATLFAVLILSCEETSSHKPLGTESRLSDSTLNRIGVRLAREFNAGEYNAAGEYALLDSLFNYGAFYDRMVLPQEPDPDERAAYVRQKKRQALFKGLIGKRTTPSWRESKTMRFVGIRRDSLSGTSLMFRISSSSTKPGTVSLDINYIEFLIQENDGQGIISDFRLLNEGKYYSTKVRQDASVAMKLRFRQLEHPSKSSNEAAALGDLIARGHAAEALDRSERLDPMIRREHPIQFARVTAAAALNDSVRYQEVIDEWFAVDPRNPIVHFYRMIDHLRTKQYDSALIDLDRIDEYVHDPYLDFIRGIIAIRQEDYAKAANYGAELLRHDSLLREPYDIEATIGMKREDYARVAEAFSRMQRNGAADIDFRSIEAEPSYATFVRSPEYARLKRTYGKN